MCLKASQTRHSGVLQQILVYPLAEYDGTMKSEDWSQIRKLPPKEAIGEAETQWVFREKFFDELPAVLADAPPLPGEEARYAQIYALLEAIKNNPAIKPVLIQTAAEADDELVKAFVPVPQLWKAASLQLEHNQQRGRVWRRLFHRHGDCKVQHPRQLTQ